MTDSLSTTVATTETSQLDNPSLYGLFRCSHILASLIYFVKKDNEKSTFGRRIFPFLLLGRNKTTSVGRRGYTKGLYFVL